MLFTAVVAVCVASHAVASAATVPLPEKVYYDLEDAENLFKNHIKEYQRMYNLEEYNKRLDIFKQSLKMINELNAEFPRTVFEITRFTDLDAEERKSYLGFRPSSHKYIKEHNLPLNVEMKPAPDSFDWRDHGAVTFVKDQGNCGSCYIFSTIGSIEGQYAIKHKQCVAFSEQQCLDCLDIGGCMGGIMDDVMNKLAQRAGCMKEEDYPYHAKVEQQCREKADKVVAKVTGSVVLNITNAGDLKQKLFNYGPLSIALCAADLFHYKSGIIHPKGCSLDSSTVNHAVLLVGYGEENGEKYWIIKNSWGEESGEKGYVRLLRGVNACCAELTFIAVARVD